MGKALSDWMNKTKLCYSENGCVVVNMVIGKSEILNETQVNCYWEKSKKIFKFKEDCANWRKISRILSICQCKEDIEGNLYKMFGKDTEK